MSIKKNIEELLFKSGISMYEVSKNTGIAQTTLSRYTRKETDLKNMRLGHAIKLNNYYLKNKGAIEMRKEMRDLREWEVIEKVNEILEEDVTENFNEAQERSSINGTDFFYVSNSNNATIKINVYMSDDEVDVLYSIEEDVFRD